MYLIAPSKVCMKLLQSVSMERRKNLYENRMCNQWDNWRAYGPELLL